MTYVEISQRLGLPALLISVVGGSHAIEFISPGIEIHNYRFWFGDPTVQEVIAECQLVPAT